jgi:hypothetical protein
MGMGMGIVIEGGGESEEWNVGMWNVRGGVRLGLVFIFICAVSGRRCPNREGL